MIARGISSSPLLRLLAAFVVSVLVMYSPLITTAAAATTGIEEQGQNNVLGATESFFFNEDESIAFNEDEQIFSGLRGSESSEQDQQIEFESIEDFLCSSSFSDQFSMLCDLYNQSDVFRSSSMNNGTDENGSISSRFIGSSNVNFELNNNAPFTLFAPTNSAFNQAPLSILLPPGLFVDDFLSTHVLFDSALSFDQLRSNCGVPLPTRFSGEDTTTLCSLQALGDGALAYQVGEGNIPTNRPRIISRAISVPNGYIYAIDNFIRPSQFLFNNNDNKNGCCAAKRTGNNKSNIARCNASRNNCSNLNQCSGRWLKNKFCKRPSRSPTRKPTRNPTRSPVIDKCICSNNNECINKVTFTYTAKRCDGTNSGDGSTTGNKDTAEYCTDSPANPDGAKKSLPATDATADWRFIVVNCEDDPFSAANSLNGSDGQSIPKDGEPFVLNFANMIAERCLPKCLKIAIRKKNEANKIAQVFHINTNSGCLSTDNSKPLSKKQAIGSFQTQDNPLFFQCLPF
jgi:hypothetical protein